MKTLDPFACEELESEESESQNSLVKAAVPRIHDLISPAEITKAIVEIRHSVFQHGAMTVNSSADTHSFRLLSDEFGWHLDTARKQFYAVPIAGEISRPARALEFGDVFPKVSRHNLNDRQHPARQLSAHAWRVAKKLISRFNISFSDYHVDYAFSAKLHTHLRFRCSSFFLQKGRVLKQIFVRLVTKLIPAEVWHFARLLAGPFADALTVTIIWQNLDEVKSVYKTAPALLPVWLTWTRSRIRSKLVTPVRKQLRLSRLKTVNSASLCLRGILQTVQKEIFADQLNPRAWRWLCRQSHVWGQSLARYLHSAERLAAFINLIADLRVQPKLPLYRWLIKHFFIYQDDYAQLLVGERAGFNQAFFSAFVERANCAKMRFKNHPENQSGRKFFYRAVNGELETEFSLVFDWWRRAAPALDKNQRTAKWNWFVRQQAVWHDELHKLKIQKLRKSSWDSFVPATIADKWLAVPLTNSLQLFYEGSLMHHCVRVYDEDCLANHSRIFHLARIGDKTNAPPSIPAEDDLRDYWTSELFVEHATLELRRSFDSWSVTQIHSFCNATNVSAECRAFANHVKSLYNQSQRSTTAKLQ